MLYLIRKLALVAAILFAAQASAAALFDDNAVIEVELTGPIQLLIKNKRDRKELPFILSANGVEHQVLVRVRGKSRLRICSFPPLRLNFSGDDTAHSVFAGQDKLKLVTHCRGRSAAQVDALQEFAVYRIFNQISEVGYKVRLLRVTYTDTDERSKNETLVHYGFVLESQTALAERLGGQPANVAGISLKSLDDDHEAAVYVFQYLVGNTDWSMVKAEEDDVCCHNGDILDIGAKRYYVPYDFDLTGVVNAQYAYPDPALPIRRVTQRMYRGFCLPSDTLQSALSTIKSRQADILSVLNEIPGLPDKEQRQSINYINQFFRRAEDEEKMLQGLERRCL